ncbi:MAG TPA: sugar ABC transporter permease [Thermodesulfobacterium commune]|nr:MAG: ABC-2 type transporter [Desulfonauticus sp. 38_4375]HCP10155.1 sugar ABC transporter permease [Thermodesulfobacterium commune]
MKILVRNKIINFNDFITALKTQIRVIYALILREIITRYGRENLGFLWLFLEPVIFVAGVVILFTKFRADRGAAHFFIPIATIIFTGWLSNKLWMTSSSRVMTAIEANIGLFYHRLVRPLDVYFARIILEIVALTGTFMILSVILVSIHIINSPASYFHIVSGWYLMAWFTIAFSLIISGLNTLTNNILQRIWSPINLGLFIASGTFFLVEWIPPQFRPYILLLPQVHNLEMIRYGFLGNYMHPYYNVMYSVCANIFLMLLGLMLVKLSAKKLEIE